MNNISTMSVGNLRFLTTKRALHSLDEALFESLQMLKFAASSTTFQIFSQDVFMEVEEGQDGKISVSRPIVGFLTSHDFYKIFDQRSQNLQVMLFEDKVGLWENFLAFKGNSKGRIRISQGDLEQRVYFERVLTN